MLERFADITRGFLLSTSDNPAKRFLAISLPAAGWIFRIDRSVFRVPRRSPRLIRGDFTKEESPIERSRTRRCMEIEAADPPWEHHPLCSAVFIGNHGSVGDSRIEAGIDGALGNGGAVSQELAYLLVACVHHGTPLWYFTSAIIPDHLRLFVSCFVLENLLEISKLARFISLWKCINDCQWDNQYYVFVFSQSVKSKLNNWQLYFNNIDWNITSVSSIDIQLRWILLVRIIIYLLILFCS